MLYVTGDTHGDYERFTSSALKKLKKGDTLFICGDFGFIWDGSKNEEKMLKKIGKLKYNVCFIDGTHENFERLRSYEVSEFKGGKVHHITGNLYHLMRGQVYDFDGVSVFAMGGGESPDIDIRSDLNSWSGDEIPTEAELDWMTAVSSAPTSTPSTGLEKARNRSANQGSSARGDMELDMRSMPVMRTAKPRQT